VADQGSEGLISPFLRKQRLRAARPYLLGKVLDVGCGSGVLAGVVHFDSYVGVDIDKTSLDQAAREHPRHTFSSALPPETESFDTVVALAVIEHVKKPAYFLAELALRLTTVSGARIVVTTPHPTAEWIHDAGARVGLFSRHANEEHEQLLDREMLTDVGVAAGLRLIKYRRFLLGANQLAIYARP
jgi:SAM-dependent methyltransferase